MPRVYSIKALQSHAGNMKKKGDFIFSGWVKKLEIVEFKYVPDLEDFKD